MGKINQYLRLQNYSWDFTLQWVGLILIMITISGCERSRTIAREPPDYEPQLTIHCLVSPQSGAQAIIMYNEPLGENPDGLIPQIPVLEVWLLLNGKRYKKFESDSVSRYNIPSEELDLVIGESYAMEVVDHSNDKFYVSGNSHLPDKPRILSAKAIRDSGFADHFALEVVLGKSEFTIDAISVFPIILDSLGLPVVQLSGGNRQVLTPWEKINSHVRYNNEGSWTESKLLFRLQSGYTDDENHFYNSDQVDITVVYLSEELSRFVRDVDELHFSGEDIFQMVRPVYSNFQSGSGIFGLYNETRKELIIEE